MPTAEPPTDLVAQMSGWRFSLGTMMAGFTTLSVILGTLIVSPPELGEIVLRVISISVTALLTVGAIYSKGSVRAFCIGAGVTVCSSFTWNGEQLLDGIVEAINPWVIVQPASPQNPGFQPVQFLPPSAGSASRKFATDSLLGNPITLRSIAWAILYLIACVNGLLCVRASRFFRRWP